MTFENGELVFEGFLDKKNVIAIVGASSNKEKWGYKVYKKLREAGFEVYPVNPKYKEIEGEKCYPDLASLPQKPDVVITVVKPEVTKKIVEECKRLGIKRIWMQTGSESKKAIEFCKKNGISVVYGACFVVNGLKEKFS